MGITKKSNSEEHPKLRANCINRLFFWWVKDIFYYGKKNNILASDLYDPLPEDRSEPVSNALEISWKKEQDKAHRSNRKPRLKSALIKTYRGEFIKYTIFYFVHACTMILRPIPLERLTSYFHPASTMTTLEAYMHATLLVFLLVFPIILIRNSYTEMNRIGIRMKIACISLMYKKILRLSFSTANRNTGGSIINLMTNDVAKFERLVIFLPFVFIVPLQLIIETYLLWRHLGHAAFIGTILMCIQILPIQVLFYKLTRKFRKKLSARVDERIFLVNEIIHGIRTIKMYVWEKAFEKLVYLTRSREINFYLKMSYIDSITLALAVFAYRLSIYFTVLVYALQNGTLSASTVVWVIQRMYNLRQNLGTFFATAIKFLADTNVSFKRIETFLLLPEVKSNVQSIELENESTSISIKKVTVSWDESLNDKTLDDVNIDVVLNKLYAIIGEVGSGKSTLLKLILGELRPVTGEIFVRGNVSYASQDPWIFSGSVRDNIVFGEKYDERKYNQIIEACALTQDFSQLPYGDKTLVGEKGINLSGGQCARINLARAIYRDANIYLFDDPLSAVDTHVAKKLFEDSINGLLKEKTRILVTHNIQLLKEVDKIILLKNGKIEFQGTFHEFYKNDRYLSHLPSNYETEKLVEQNDDVSDSKNVTMTSDSSETNENKQDEPKETEELIARGYVAKSVYWKYLCAGGSNFALLALLVILILSVLSVSGFDYWLIIWTKQEEIHFKKYSNITNSTFLKTSQSNNFSYVTKSLGICAALIATVVITSILKNLIFYRVFLNGSKNIHNDMFARLMKVPLQFFEVNNSGRILNRFSQDTGDADEILSRATFIAIDDSLTIAQFMIPILIIKWWYVFPLSISGYVVSKFSQNFVSTAQDIKRLESNARSPTLSLAVSSLTGLLTIRSCGAEKIVIKALNSFQNKNISAHFLIVMLGTFFGLWLELLMYLLIAFTAYGSIAFVSQGMFSSEVGLILLQLMNISRRLHYSVKQISETATHMTSVERMFQFTELQQEDPLEDKHLSKPPKFWPDQGSMKFESVYLRYSDDIEPVLKNLNFVVEPAAKIGIVGRTGAGKSSLISALFRLAKIDGTLFIDNIDIKKISLPDLRTRISIIPQESILFSSSLRSNLDPYNEFDDASIWSALEDVELNKTFDSLDHAFDRGGSNLSSGQRQLICLARAIVKRNKILVLDEATAKVDPATDALIQKTIRMKFKDCTVLTIAHRLNTIMDSDKVLVMDHGEVIEFDHPHLLLQQDDSYFLKMVEQTGNVMSQHLRMVAEQVYNANVNTKLTVLTDNNPIENNNSR